MSQCVPDAPECRYKSFGVILLMKWANKGLILNPHEAQHFEVLRFALGPVSSHFKVHIQQPTALKGKI